LNPLNKKIRANLETHSASSAIREENEISDRIQTDQFVKRLEANMLAEKELILLSRTMPTSQSLEAKVDTAQSNVLRAPEPLANDQWEAKYGTKKPN